MDLPVVTAAPPMMAGNFLPSSRRRKPPAQAGPQGAMFRDGSNAGDTGYVPTVVEYAFARPAFTAMKFRGRPRSGLLDQGDRAQRNGLRRTRREGLRADVAAWQAKPKKSAPG